MTELRDQLARPLRDLRISVMDRCNLRCTYCMPAEKFGPDHAFLPPGEWLSFEEIWRLTAMMADFGLRKIRWTGGEPLLRPDLARLIAGTRTRVGHLEMALTTNGHALAAQAQGLAAAGLDRVTVSLDALDPTIYARMAGGRGEVGRVLEGIAAARAAGLPVKINAVIRRGVNDGEILPLAEWAYSESLTLRFIEYMDVGMTNGWSAQEVVPSAEILRLLHSEWDLSPVEAASHGEVARRYAHANGRCEIGLISSITQPFCHSCTRARLSADGKLFLCLFAANGLDLRALLRGDVEEESLRETIRNAWQRRSDRYSELRQQSTPHPKAEMSYLGG